MQLWQTRDVQRQPWSCWNPVQARSGVEDFGRSLIKVSEGQTHQPHDICSRPLEAMRSRMRSSKPPSLVVVSTPTSAKSVTVKRGETGGCWTCAAEISPSQNKDGTSCLLLSDFSGKLCLACGFWWNNPAFVHHLELPVIFLAFLKSCWMVEFRTVLLALPTVL